jgi:hypothetical protein
MDRSDPDIRNQNSELHTLMYVSRIKRLDTRSTSLVRSTFRLLKCKGNNLTADYTARKQKLYYLMHSNYFYPSILKDYASQIYSNCIDNHHLNWFHLFNHLFVPTVSSTYSNFHQQSFLQYYQNDFNSLINHFYTNWHISK